MIGTYYNSISSCPLAVFIEVLITENPAKLRRWGFPPLVKMAEAWDVIFDEYLREQDESKYQLLLRRLKDVAITKNKIRLSIGALQVLELKYNPKLVEVLRLLGYRYKFNPKAPEAYFKDLDRVRKEVKNLTNYVQEAEEKLRSKEKSAVKEADFDGILVELSRFQGYRMDKKQVTVSEFLQVLKNYKTLNQKKDGKQRKNR